MTGEMSQNPANTLTATPEPAPEPAPEQPAKPAKRHARTPLRRPARWIKDLFAGRMSGRYLVGVYLVCLCIIAMGLPSAYSLRFPGVTQDVLGTPEGADTPVIAVEGADTYQDTGKLLMTTVSVAGAYSPITGFDVAWTYLDQSATIMPRELVVPYGDSGEDSEKESDDQMSEAEESARKQALAYITSHNLIDNFDADSVKITITPGDIGGPSAGTMYTLGIIDMLTPDDETGGATIAGTGTMEDDQTVGAIGGIRQKMIGARDAGATWFLAPSSNCDEVIGHVPDGLRDVSVSTLDEAYQAVVAIGKGEGDSLPHCSTEAYEKATSGDAS